ncbi:hypothetical protein MF646_22445, partial [Halalkalibacter sp. MEB205]|nr:hypothetical protein [Halalkalibacter alkaliphilus]
MLFLEALCEVYEKKQLVSQGDMEFFKMSYHVVTIGISEEDAVPPGVLLIYSLDPSLLFLCGACPPGNVLAHPFSSTGVIIHEVVLRSNSRCVTKRKGSSHRGTRCFSEM